MKLNKTLFFSYLLIWIIVGLIVFDKIVPMIVFIIIGGGSTGLIIATKTKKE
ncbi:hypothetical protein [Salinicoccus roseus]|uniref:hypothetical protein n=1 Tax=Salinicoccus roseus TaxID=45670 RepID=UPI001EF409CA|nr:hypothetical protein [Salinicoccus roseus]MCG7333364.1 hypothetical protein [Salinicoccus roseus]